MADEDLIKALEEIRDFGFKNSGKGFTCAKMAEKALAGYADGMPLSRMLYAVVVLERDRDTYHKTWMGRDRVSFAQQIEHDNVMNKYEWAINFFKRHGV